MLVRTQRNGNDETGLHIGNSNARRYFRKRAPSIDLLLDDLRIRCTLAPDFWEGRPQIHDRRLSEWLVFKDSRRGSNCRPMLLTMLPSGVDTFVVQPKAAASPEDFGVEITLPRNIKSASLFPRPSSPAVQARMPA